MARILPQDKRLPFSFRNMEEFNRYKNLCLGLPVRVLRRDVPWGYVRDSEDKMLALPNETALRHLHKAKEYLKDCSYADVANWLTSCGYAISHYGLYKLLAERSPFDEIMLPVEERMKL